MNEKTDGGLKCLIVIVTWVWMMDLYVQSPIHYIKEYYTYIYSYIYIHNQQFKSRIKQKIFHWCCQKNECGKHQRAIVEGLFVFLCRKIRLWILIFLVEVERPVYSVWPFCLELYSQVFWTFEKCYMTKKITFFGNLRIIKISQRILSDVSSFLRNQLKCKSANSFPYKCTPWSVYLNHSYA